MSLNANVMTSLLNWTCKERVYLDSDRTLDVRRNSEAQLRTVFKPDLSFTQNSFQESYLSFIHLCIFDPS